MSLKSALYATAAMAALASQGYGSAFGSSMSPRTVGDSKRTLTPKQKKVRWLMNEGVYCTVTDTRVAPTYEIVGYISIVCMLKKRSKVSSVLRTWHEAAEAAIEKALTLI